MGVALGGAVCWANDETMACVPQKSQKRRSARAAGRGAGAEGGGASRREGVVACVTRLKRTCHVLSTAQCRMLRVLARPCVVVREAAKQDKKERFTALMHHVTFELLKEAFFWLKREAAGPRRGQSQQASRLQ